MTEVKAKRAYRSARREQQAEATRTAILDAADRLFRAEGWTSTTMAAIAREAGVAAETVYARFGSKRTIAHELVIRATRGAEPQTPMMQQEHRARVIELASGAAMIDAFAEDVSQVLARGTPILAILATAAEADTSMAELYADLHASRRRNLRRLVEALNGLGALRPGLDVDAAVETVWSIASPELWLVRTRHLGATPASNRMWIAEMLKQALLA